MNAMQLLIFVPTMQLVSTHMVLMSASVLMVSLGMDLIALVRKICDYLSKNLQR